MYFTVILFIYKIHIMTVEALQHLDGAEIMYSKSSSRIALKSREMELCETIKILKYDQNATDLSVVFKLFIKQI